jgi:hypothetical protein
MNVNGVLASLNFPTMPSYAGKQFVAAARSVPDKALRAIQAWNVVNGFDETTGLPRTGVTP